MFVHDTKISKVELKTPTEKLFPEGESLLTSSGPANGQHWKVLSLMEKRNATPKAAKIAAEAAKNAAEAAANPTDTTEKVNFSKDTGKMREEGDHCRTANENIMLENVDSPIPIKILKRPMPTSPDAVSKEHAPTCTNPANENPVTPSTPLFVKGKNYKLLFEEVTKRLFEQTEAGKKMYLEHEAAHNELKRKYEEETKSKDSRILADKAGSTHQEL